MWIPTFAAGKTLDTTSVEQDLESINLDVDRYIENLNGAKTALVLTRESGYTEGGIASLYIYIYVSDFAYNTSAAYSDKLVFDLLKIKLASKIDENGRPISYIETFANYVSRSEDRHFYKFRIDGLSGFEWEKGRLYYIDSYSIAPSKIPDFGYVDSSGQYGSDLETLQNETRQSEVTRRGYYFTGTEKRGTLGCDALQDTIIDLETKNTVYRTVSSDKGEDYQYDIFSVYFAVPNYYLEKYDYLNAITYKYYEQLYNAVVTDKEEEYEAVQKMLGVDFSGDFKTGYGEIYAGVYNANDYYYPGGDSVDLACKYRINGTTYKGDLIQGEKVSHILNVYSVEDHNDDDIFINPYEITNFFNYDEKGNPSKWVVKTTSLNDKFNVNSFSGNDPSSITKFYAWLYGYNEGYETQLNNVDPIVKLDDEFFNGLVAASPSDVWCSDHLVNKRDAKTLKSYYDSAKLKDETVYILRFAVRDYYAPGCDIWSGTKAFESIDRTNSDGFYVLATGFNDFNIISLTYRKGTQDFVVLVNDEPQDINGGITEPTDGVGENMGEAVSDFFGGVSDKFGGWFDDLFGDFADTMSQILKVVRIVLVVFVGILLFSILIKPISIIFESVFSKLKNRKDKDK